MLFLKNGVGIAYMLKKAAIIMLFVTIISETESTPIKKCTHLCLVKRMD